MVRRRSDPDDDERRLSNNNHKMNDPPPSYYGEERSSGPPTHKQSHPQEPPGKWGTTTFAEATPYSNIIQKYVDEGNDEQGHRRGERWRSSEREEFFRTNEYTNYTNTTNNERSAPIFGTSSIADADLLRWRRQRQQQHEYEEEELNNNFNHYDDYADYPAEEVGEEENESYNNNNNDEDNNTYNSAGQPSEGSISQITYDGPESKENESLTAILSDYVIQISNWIGSLLGYSNINKGNSSTKKKQNVAGDKLRFMLILAIIAVYILKQILHQVLVVHQASPAAVLSGVLSTVVHLPATLLHNGDADGGNDDDSTTKERPAFVYNHPYVTSSYYASTSSITVLEDMYDKQVLPKKDRAPDKERGIVSRLAILRPFCEFDADALPTTFACWNSLVPCRAAEMDLGDDDEGVDEWVLFDMSINGTGRRLEDEVNARDWECENEENEYLNNEENSSPAPTTSPTATTSSSWSFRGIANSLFKRCKRKRTKSEEKEKDYFDDVPADGLRTTSTDLFLFYSQTFSENDVAMKAVDEIMQEFFSVGGWSRCFDNIYAVEANIPKELDLYIRKSLFQIVDLIYLLLF